MDEHLKQLRAVLAEVSDLNYAMAVLGWDQQTFMPDGGAEERGDQLSTLARLAHERMTAPVLGQLLSNLQPYAAGLPAGSDDACLVRVARRDYERAVKVPPAWVAEFARVTAVAQNVWQQARAASDFPRFQPHLERIVELRREYASFFAPYSHVYDSLVEDFEPGMKTADVQAIFDILRPAQVALVEAIAGRPQVDDSFLHQEFQPQGQWDFGAKVVTGMGFDWNRGRQDRSVHPFTTSFGLGDVRITTHVRPDSLVSALFGSIHETGHALYEQGFDPALRRTPLAAGASYALHESQSRLWENIVGSSKAFWRHFYPQLQQQFPVQLGNVDLDSFYRGVNRVNPSLIRIEADEATYNLHIMLRMELEIALMSGDLRPADLPTAWAERMQAYLGITPPDDARGVLQDVHWSNGSFGYFPTYALGNLISAQLWERACADLPDLETRIAEGHFEILLGWLRENVHRHGAKFEPQALVERITGSRIDPQPYLRYLTRKYSEIYAL